MLICSNLGARSFRDGNQGICKYKESNMGQSAGVSSSKHFELSVYVFSFVCFCSPLRSFFRLNNLKKVVKDVPIQVSFLGQLSWISFTEMSDDVMFVCFGCYGRLPIPLLRRSQEKF